ncbi:MAG: hypothetical protein HRT74_11355 [Flavobacteriales bacterium]|nr:hypothetical protein [Flavobacteriales bacterium]
MSFDHNSLFVCSLLILTTLATSCAEMDQPSTDSNQVNEPKKEILIPLMKHGFNSAMLDQDGSLWFSSNGEGVVHYSSDGIQHFTESNGLNSDQVFALASDQNNVIWIGTDEGLAKYDGESFEHITLPFQDTSSQWLDKVSNSINPNGIRTLAVDNDNMLWIGTGGGGAYSYNGKTFQPFLREIGAKQEDSLYHNWVPFIEKDQEGHLWFASMTKGGLSKFNGTTFSQYLVEDGLSDNQVRTIHSDDSGNIWIGFNGNRNSGLTVINGDNVQTYSLDDGLCNQRIRSIYKDRKGNLWIGAHHGNLCIFDGHEFTEFKYNNMSFSDISFILSDYNDNIWFGGQNGIWMYDGTDVIKMTTGHD